MPEILKISCGSSLALACGSPFSIPLYVFMCSPALPSLPTLLVHRRCSQPLQRHSLSGSGSPATVGPPRLASPLPATFLTLRPRRSLKCCFPARHPLVIRVLHDWLVAPCFRVRPIGCLPATGACLPVEFACPLRFCPGLSGFLLPSACAVAGSCSLLALGGLFGFQGSPCFSLSLNPLYYRVDYLSTFFSTFFHFFLSFFHIFLKGFWSIGSLHNH